LRFWDTSALVSLLALETSSWKTRELYRQDREMVLWWGTPVECVSSLARIEREGKVAAVALQRAWSVFRNLRARAVEIQPAEDLRLSAEHLLSRHPLRAADSLQLAAALAWRQGYPGGASFVTLDRQLRSAAALEGFRVLPYDEEVHDSVLSGGAVFELRDRPTSLYGEPAQMEEAESVMREDRDVLQKLAERP
jgi:predicted nucleic acid-binding protein